MSTYTTPAGATDLLGSAPTPPARPIEVRRTTLLKGGGFIGFFGVFLPLLTLLIELATRMCTQGVLDVLPTPIHVGLVAAVPIANLLVLLRTRRETPPSPRAMHALGFLNGVAIGVATCYALAFLPITPFAFVGILVYGVGLLPLSPLFSAIAAVMCSRRLATAWIKPDHNYVPAPGMWPGILAALLALGAMLMPAAVVRYGLSDALSQDVATRDAGVRFLRSYASREALLRECYWHSRSRLNAFSMFDDERGWSDVADAQRVFYQVTGASFDSYPRPMSHNRGWLTSAEQSRTWMDDDGESWDSDWDERGGDRVGGRLLPGLQLATSRIDGSVNADAATAYYEWTLEFRNDKTWQQEARCRIALPPDGVVSRLTLWVQGEEREAAFGGRAQVRQAYENVVKVQRRDPVLVTSAGPDRVLMQCFPVPPGGTMKVRVGITAPVRLDSPAAGTVALPCFAERNFKIRPETTHAVHIESRTPINAATPARLAYTAAAKPGDPGALQGFTPDDALRQGVAVTVPRASEAPAVVWFDDPYDKSVGTVVQRIEGVSEAPPTRVVLALDASASAAQALPAVADALADLPAGVAINAVVSRDGVTQLDGDAQSIATRLKQVECAGGQDSVPALTRAWELAAADAKAVVLWIHGPQPMLIEPVDALKQRVEQFTGGPKLMHLHLGRGNNVVVEELEHFARAEAVPMTPAGSDVKAALKSLFASWAADAKHWRFVRTADGKPAGDGAKSGDIQIVRLWANEQVHALAARPPLGQSSRAPEATALAVRHHLVTPVSGAVVLETQQQFDAAGLTPVTAIPLPPAVWMIVLVLPVVWWAGRRLQKPRCV